MTPETTPVTTDNTEALIAELEAQLGQQGESGGDTPKEEASVTPEGGDHAPPTDAEASQEKQGQPESEKGKTREDKEEERKAKTWAQINAEKEEAKRIKAEAERARAEAERLRREAEDRARNAGQFTPEDYLAAAKRFEADGDVDSAAAARERASALKRDIEAANARVERERREGDLRAAIETVRASHPELDDPNSPLRKAVDEILTASPELKTYGNGIIGAVEGAKIKLRATKVEELEKELAEVRSKLEDREQRLQPGGATPSKPEKSKGFESLSEKEQYAILMAAAKEADNEGIGISALSFR